MTEHDDAKPVLRVDGIDILLDTVSHDLRRAYESAALAVSMAKASPARNAMKAELNRIAKAILAEALPTLALKASPRSYGARGFFTALAQRTS